MEFFINNLPTVLCLIVGLVLVVIEMFLPGFGFVGFSGVLLLAGSVIFTWINYGAMALSSPVSICPFAKAESAAADASYAPWT